MEKKLNCVLLIDDDEPTNFINKFIIEQSGLTNKVHVAQSGKEALHLLLSKHNDNVVFPCPDLIFLDINMPAMDGWEFLEQYRMLSSIQKGKIIIVMLTTSLNPDDELKAKEFTEIAAFRNKPLTQQILESVIEKHF